MLVLGVALLALFLFIGGGAAIYLSTPPTQQDPNAGLVGGASPTSSLAVFVQETPTAEATPVPSPTPFFFSIDPGSPPPSGFPFSPSPSISIVPTGPTPTPTQQTGPTPTPIRTPRPPTPTPTNTPPPAGPNAGFAAAIIGRQVSFTNKSSGAGLTFAWDFGDGNGAFKANPKHTYANTTADYTVTLTVTDSLGRTATRSKNVHIEEQVVTPPPPPTEPPTEPPPASNAP